MSKRILMLADVGSFWTKRYIENLLLPDGWEVTLFPIWEPEGQFDSFYHQSGVTVYRDRHTLPVIRHIPRLRMWTRVWLNARDLRRLGPFDAVHNHYLSQRDLALGKALWRANPGARWVCSLWGSDLLRSPAIELRRMAPYLRLCDAVTVHSALNVERVRELYGASVAAKTHLVYFGQTVYDDIARVRSMADQAACRAHFGLPADKRVICLGSNGNPAQKHLELLRALRALPDDVLSGWSLVLQMTYGRVGPDYEREVREAAAALPCHTLMLHEFMDGTESAYLRLAADVFVLAIPTDMFSASMQEYLYAGARVVLASWLRYPQLDELAIATRSFDSFDQAPALIAAAAAEVLPPDQRAARDQLPKRYSWSAVRRGWVELYSGGIAAGCADAQRSGR